MRVLVTGHDGDDLAGFDAVIHLAALSNDPIGDLNPDCTYAVNIRALRWRIRRPAVAACPSAIGA